ncbi:MAG: hypothetical protein AMDU3_IPLC00004G0438 [Thermoplasmatales archaeon I-plasma]|jgi:uncharacterized LabA/DUF88 family protein|nr:MAG: hypothetical protein AMDU3_IPLC00004G0438 [Thermoplasmatales archaeon I-plasma]
MKKAALLIDNSNFYHSLKDSRRLPFPPADYEKLFSLLSEQFGFDLRTVYLYDAIKDSSKEKSQYAQQQKFHSGIRALSAKWPVTIKTRKLKYRPFGREFIPEEKGVDVLLVVDAITLALNGEIETIIVLSGDADFVPLIEFLKIRKVETVNLHLYSGSSTELRQACDSHILITFQDSTLMLK